MKYFGTDGIRNKATFFVNNNFAYNVGRSLSLLCNKNIYLGYDTRESSELIAHSIISGALSKGLNIYNLNMTSTPCIAYYSLLNNAIGISITASHNPYLDNGIKIFINGIKISDELMLSIEEYIDNPDTEILYGTIHNKCPLEYISFLNQFKTNTSNILLDAANGATSSIAPHFFKNIINNNPNGININQECGSTYISSIVNKTIDNFDYGVCLDGDGDRLLIVDKDGYIYSGDMLVYFLAKHYNLNKVVLTKMVNPGIVNLLNQNNISISLSNVGDANVYSLMKKNDILLGGEDSGHIINLHLLPFGDGLLNALVIIKIMNDYHIKLADIINPSTKYPERLINYTNISNNQINKINYLITEYQDDPNFKILFRKSGTEHLYRLYLSHQDSNILNNIVEDLNNE